MRYLIALFVFAAVVAACGGDSATPVPADGDVGGTTVSPMSDSTVPESPEVPTDPGDVGGIRLTIGAETWEFVGSQCAFYNAEPGEDGSEWNVSMKDGDLQVYVSVDSFVGPSVKLNNVESQGVLSWEAEGDAVTIQVDGNEITAEGTFTDGATGLGSQQGTLTAACRSWFDGG